MDWRQFENLFESIKGLGRQRLIALGMAGAIVFAVISIGSYFASRSSMETLYVGLTPPDISRMGSVLSEAGITFEPSMDGTKLAVPIGQAAQARALLAEKGLPGSPNAGYELFDKLGALGLTSFMQEVTRARALEGELARTIQYLKGVRAARVHIFLPDQNALRSKKQAPSASVVIRTDVSGDSAAAPAIRHLVAAAIPEMTPDQVQVIGTDGTLLGGAGSTTTGDATVQMLDLERNVAQQIKDSVQRTLSPYLGLDNFEVSALARLNLDKHESTETNYDPESKVERSTKTVKEAQSSQDGGKSQVTVDKNVPGASPSSNEQGKKAQDRKEETTNYEISSKSASTKSEGYRIDSLSVAVVVNKKRLAEAIGHDPKPEELEKQVAEIQNLALSAAGIDTKRGDKINVTAVDFAPNQLGSDAASASASSTMWLALAGTGIKSLTILLLATIVILAGFRPAMRTLLSGSASAVAIAGASGGVAALGAPGMASAEGAALPLDMPEMASPLLAGDNPFEIEMRSGFASDGALAGGSAFGQSTGPVEKLGAMIDRDRDQAAAVLKHWVRNG